MMYDGEVVMIAMAATALLVIALTLFAFQVTPHSSHYNNNLIFSHFYIKIYLFQTNLLFVKRILLLDKD